MSEIFQSPSKEKAQHKRPIGRFLLDRTFEKPAEAHDMYAYAAKFAMEYHDIINPKWRASRVSVEKLGGRHVELEFSIGSDEESCYVWRLHAGNEQYDVWCRENGCSIIYYELTSQRAVMKKREADNPETLAVLKDLIEHMTDTYDFHKNTSSIRGDSVKTYAAIQELERKKSSNEFSCRDAKNLHALNNHLFMAGFPVGARDISKLQPLIQ